jgi:hypothetical protein
MTRFFFSTETFRSQSLCNVLCLAFRQVQVWHIWHVTENSSFCTIYHVLYQYRLYKTFYYIKINEDKTQIIYFSHRHRPPDAHLTLNGRNIPFVNHEKYLVVIFDKRSTWGLHIEMIEAKNFRTFIRIYFVLKSECLSANIKLTLYNAMIRSVMTYACPAWELAADT